jgi:hypothetical protein
MLAKWVFYCLSHNFDPRTLAVNVSKAKDKEKFLKALR